ncbi:Tic20 family protein [Prochlorococcus sp. MIT 1300]|uniref:Tic20 family protein n=1 Tax=Prochlorococcus sp. MIT 1300 TaxID=3096218 RepID=UPI002A74E180|nr:Tic20 family protein [Prochlorococcus sp. MIT 1300]
MLIPAWQRLLGLLIYMLPWSDGIPFGRHLFVEFPFLQIFALPALPLLIFEQTIPFGGFLIFLILFLAVIRNQSVPYFLRFNALQALLIDIVIIVLSYAFQIILQPFNTSLLVRSLSSTVWVSTLAIVIFAFIECIRGKEPDLPGISQAVKMQLF